MTARALLIPTEGDPRVVTVDPQDYRSLGAVIGADYIERVRMIEGVALVVDETGLFAQKPINPASGVLYPGRLVGDVLVVGEEWVDDEDGGGGLDFCGLSDTQLAWVVARLNLGRVVV